MKNAIRWILTAALITGVLFEAGLFTGIAVALIAIRLELDAANKTFDDALDWFKDHVDG